MRWQNRILTRSSDLLLPAKRLTWFVPLPKRSQISPPCRTAQTARHCRTTPYSHRASSRPQLAQGAWPRDPPAGQGFSHWPFHPVSPSLAHGGLRWPRTQIIIRNKYRCFFGQYRRLRDGLNKKHLLDGHHKNIPMIIPRSCQQIDNSIDNSKKDIKGGFHAPLPGKYPLVIRHNYSWFTYHTWRFSIAIWGFP